MSDDKRAVEEGRILEEFKERIRDIVKPDQDDYYLRKWLIARSFNIDKAEQMYRTSMAFRDKMKADSLLEDYEQPEVLQKYLTGGFCGHDKDGSPVRVELFGYLDMKGLMSSCKKTDLEKSKLLQCEGICRDWRLQSKQRGKRVDGLTVILDMDKVGTRSLWRPGLQMYLHTVKILEDNYPEMMKYLFVINAPMIFPLLWKICRPLVSDDMKKKIHVLGSDFKSALLKYIDPEELPVYMGGTQTDPDGNPRCVTKINQGGPVPRHYYLSEAGTSEGMCEVMVGRADKLRLEFYVDKPGSILRWEFRTEDHDISFYVTFRANDDKTSKETEVVATKRFNCHLVTEDGSYVCDEMGTYAVVFDNSFSWVTSKKLFYLIELFTSSELMNSEIDTIASGGSWTRLYKDLQITHL